MSADPNEIQTNQNGIHDIPYTQRQSEGSVLRHESAPGAAPFPPSWIRGDEPVDQYHGLINDGPNKQLLIDRLKEAQLPRSR